MYKKELSLHSKATLTMPDVTKQVHSWQGKHLMLQLIVPGGRGGLIVMTYLVLRDIGTCLLILDRGGPSSDPLIPIINHRSLSCNSAQ